MMIDLEQLKADRKAGTEGPWHLQHDDEIWSKDDLYVGMVGNTKDTRRIARLPELEAAYIEAVAKLDKAVEVIREVDDTLEKLSGSLAELDAALLAQEIAVIALERENIAAIITAKPERDE